MIHADVEFRGAPGCGMFPCVVYTDDEREMAAYFFTGTAWDAHCMARWHRDGEALPKGLQWVPIAGDDSPDYHDLAMERRHD